MRRAAGLACATVLLGAAAQASPTLQSVRAQLAAAGPKATVDALAAGRGRGWEAVLAHVGHGEAAWLALAPELRKGTDAGTSEALEGALSDALAPAPERVLAFAPQVIALDRLCASPLIEATAAQEARWRKPRLAALAAVRDPALKDRAHACARLIAR